MSATPTPTSFPGSIDLIFIASLIITAAVAIAFERLISTYLARFAKKIKLEPHTTNNLILISRIIILFVAIAVIAKVGGLPPEWILSVSAIGGAALGFASQKTLGNFIAGLFIISAHPFKVSDYVRIGTVEGIVQEITINYTKIFTPANNMISVSNLQILDRDITNFAYEIDKVGKSPGIYCYTFEIGFDHKVSTQKIAEIFEEIFKNHLLELPKKPAFNIIRTGGVERVYLVYLYVRKPEDISKFRSVITEEVYIQWDKARTLVAA